VTVGRIGAGRFRGAAAVHPGQWELIVDFYRGSERVFRSRSRVTLK
jgi:nitrogen fixation protein FixH